MTITRVLNDKLTFCSPSLPKMWKISLWSQFWRELLKKLLLTWLQITGWWSAPPSIWLHLFLPVLFDNGLKHQGKTPHCNNNWNKKVESLKNFFSLPKKELSWASSGGDRKRSATSRTNQDVLLWERGGTITWGPFVGWKLLCSSYRFKRIKNQYTIDALA